MSDSGKKYCIVIGAYMVVKSLVNLLLGFSLGNIVTLLLSVLLAFLIIQGVSYCNYITGIYLAVICLMNLVPNITGQHWFYLAEGILDLVAAVVLFTRAK